MIRRSYHDGRHGQIHLRENAPVPGIPLICLHATAYSSKSFSGLLSALDGKRHAIALDTPGYGESDAPSVPLSIAEYADSMAEILPARADLFGYHTGVSIALEIALRHPSRVGRLWFMGVPYFQALDFAAWRERLTARHSLSEGLEQFAERWDYLVTCRPSGITLERGFANFVDELKAWPNGWWAHEALFDHDLAARLPLLTHPVTILNPAGHLDVPSRASAALIDNAVVVELPELEGAVLDRYPDRIAQILLNSSAAESGRRRSIAGTASSVRSIRAD